MPIIHAAPLVCPWKLKLGQYRLFGCGLAATCTSPLTLSRELNPPLTGRLASDSGPFTAGDSLGKAAEQFVFRDTVPKTDAGQYVIESTFSDLPVGRDRQACLPQAGCVPLTRFVCAGGRGCRAGGGFRTQERQET